MSQTAAATLNAGQIAFYATTATVIPVFVLAYVVQSRQLTTSLYRIGRDATAQTPEATVAKPSRKDRGGALARLRRMTVATAGLNLLIIVLFFLPVFGEFTALHALLTDQYMGAGLVWAGIAASCGAALGPALYAAVGLEQTLLDSRLRREAEAVLQEFDLGAMDVSTALKRLDEIDERAGRRLTAHMRLRVEPPSA